MYSFKNEIQELIKLLKTEKSFEIYFVESQVICILNKEMSKSLCLSFYLNNPPVLKSSFGRTLVLPYDVFIFNSPFKIFRFVRNYILLPKSIFARKLVFQEINENNACSFLTDNHIMNYARAFKWYGLVSIKNNTIFLLAGISKGKKIYNDNLEKNVSVELVRICSAYDFVVVGGLKKLLHHIHLLHPEIRDFVTYVDSGWSTGSGLLKAGFVKEPYETIFTFLVSPDKKKLTKIDPKTPPVLSSNEYIRTSMPVWKFRYHT